MSAISDLKVLANRFFGSRYSTEYTENELAHLRSYLFVQGYVRARIYGFEENLGDVLYDYVRSGKNGEVLGVVTLHLQPKGKAASVQVQDGIVEVRLDEELLAKVGRITGVADFVRAVNPTGVQKVANRLFPRSC